MDKWEYTVFRMEVPHKDDDLDAEVTHLDQYGQKGWELFSVTDISTNAKIAKRNYYFKRPKPEA